MSLFEPELSFADIQRISSGYVDYIKGKVMKIDISGDDVDTTLYDRDNGSGAAKEIIEYLLNKKQP